MNLVKWSFVLLFVLSILLSVCFGATLEQIDATPATNPEAFDELNNTTYHVYKISGNIPVKEAGNEAYEWQKKLLSICNSFGTGTEFKQNQVPYGPIVHCTPSIDGYIYVGINPDFHIMNQDFDVIINSLTKIAKENEIQNVPFVIGASTQPIPSVLPSSGLFPSTRPSYFEGLKENDTVLMTYGNVPKKSKGMESSEWNDKLTSIVSDLNSDPEYKENFSKYKADNHGFIEWVRVDYDFISVQVSDSYPMKSSELNKSMEIITQIGKDQGVKATPIVVYGNAQTFTIEEEEQNSLPIPGFGMAVSIFVLVGLIGVIRTKKL
ncbi:hypothetical protein [Methanolapillus millepedarum]|uniref:Uncharacterized protein n=1 Tax=Methanolapillus millepedarum TaxID=3028296 RepID=A0AA96V3G9_9EURY|nr:hypothetical protein MsAc7_14640 [Methanosarcinaceae archaeon Ac7]